MRGPYDVWAPRPRRVRLVCGDNAGGALVEMERGDDGWWTPAEPLPWATQVPEQARITGSSAVTNPLAGRWISITLSLRRTWM